MVEKQCCHGKEYRGGKMSRISFLNDSSCSFMQVDAGDL